MTAPGVVFDYESKQWGEAAVRPRPWYIQGLKLRYCLDDLRTVRGACADVGCGAGNVAKAIRRARPDLDVYGVDLSRSALAAARRDPQGVEFREGSAERLPFADGALAAVTMFDVLEHLDEPERALAEVRRVLRPGGLFHLVLPLEAQPWTVYRLLTSRGWRAKVEHCGHVQLFDDRRYRALAAAAGLPVERVRWSFHPLYALADVAYFTWLLARGPVHHSVEDFLVRRSGPAAALLKAAKGAIASAGWYESRLLRGLPGGCGHFTSRRAGR